MHFAAKARHLAGYPLLYNETNSRGHPLICVCKQSLPLAGDPVRRREESMRMDEGCIREDRDETEYLPEPAELPPARSGRRQTVSFRRAFI